MDASGGSVSYAGYEYQILVTVWSALELLVVKPITQQLELEAPSHEDIEADLRVARDDALLLVGVSSPNIRLVMQVKTRSTGPWSASNFRTLLLGANRKPTLKGPKPRTRPLEMLRNDSTMRYVLVTDAAVQGALRSFHIDHVLEESGGVKFPFRSSSLPSNEEASLAGRVAVCDMQLEALLNYRIAEVLMRNAHVPIPNHAQCIRDLREQARCRVVAGSSWSADDVWRTLREHEGSKGLSWCIDDYVEPRSYPEILATLETSHAVIISGPSGTGKTLTGMVLEERLKADLPYTVITEQSGSSVVERALLSTEPVLCHLRDPWGSTKVGDDGSWTNELVHALPRASAQHKFIVTTRAEILAEATKERLSALEPFIVRLDIADYDSDRRAKIFDKRLVRLGGATRRLAEHHRADVLAKLRRPFEIDRFIVNVQRLENLSARFEDILEASRVEAVADVVAQEIGQWSPEGPACAAIIWALLQADSQVSWTQLRSIERALRRGGRVLELEQFADFLVAGYNLRPGVEMIVLYHPEVERGLERGMGWARADAKRTLEILCDVLLVGDSGRHSGLAVAIIDALARLEDFEYEPTGAAVDALDRALLDAAAADAPVSTLQAFGRLARLATARYPPAEFTRILWAKASVSWSLGAWNLPTEEERGVMIRVAREHPVLVRNYIRDVVAHSNVVYDNEFVKTMASLIPNADKIFLSALERIAEAGWGGNIPALVLGACSGPEPPLRRIKQLGEELYRAADARWASEFEPDRVAAESEQLDQYYLEYFNMMGEQLWEPAAEVLEALIAVLRMSTGYTWVIGPEKSPELITAWIRALEFAPVVSCEELLALADETNLDSNFLYWRIIASHWSSGLDTLLRDTFTRDGLTQNVRRSITSAALASRSLADQEMLLAELVKRSSEGRQLEILFDVESSLTPHEDDLAMRLAAMASPTVARLANRSRVFAPLKVGRPLLQNDLEASALLACAADDIVAELIIEAGRYGLDIVPVARRVISGGSAEAALAAMRALAEAGGPIMTELMTVALSHADFAVRVQALNELLRIPGYSDLERVLTCARDRSPAVRLLFAREMGRLRWESAIPELFRLLSDKRDFSSQAPYGESYPRYDVALAAAQAFATYENLSTDTRVCLRKFLANANDDPRVLRTVASVIERFDDPQV